MVEGLVSVLILAFITLLFGVLKGYVQVIIPQFALLAIVIFLLIRVRVKIAKAEKEKLRTRIDELEKKIETLGGRQGQ
jgi:TctA family transporter